LTTARTDLLIELTDDQASVLKQGYPVRVFVPEFGGMSSSFVLGPPSSVLPLRRLTFFFAGNDHLGHEARVDPVRPVVLITLRPDFIEGDLSRPLYRGMPM